MPIYDLKAPKFIDTLKVASQYDETISVDELKIYPPEWLKTLYPNISEHGPQYELILKLGKIFKNRITNSDSLKQNLADDWADNFSHSLTGIPEVFVEATEILELLGRKTFASATKPYSRYQPINNISPLFQTPEYEEAFSPLIYGYLNVVAIEDVLDIKFDFLSLQVTTQEYDKVSLLIKKFFGPELTELGL